MIERVVSGMVDGWIDRWIIHSRWRGGWMDD